MLRKPNLSAVLLLIVLLLFQGLAPDLQAQMPPVPTPQELDQLLAPVALYPDALLAQITTASTNPQEILDVDNWLAQNRNLTVSQLTAAAQQQGFDPAFIALVGFPQVIEMMAENIDDYAAIGAAVTADQGQVSAFAGPGLRVGRLAQQSAAAGRGAAGAHLCDPTGKSPGGVPTAIRSHGGYTGGGGAGLVTFGIAIGITALLVSQPWGMGWLGMELGRPADLLQPRPVGRLEWRVSATTAVVPASPRNLPQSPWVWGKLGLSAAELPPTQTHQPARNPAGAHSPD